MLFYETYFVEGNINRKPIIWSHYKIITIFGPKERAILFLGKVYEKGPKIKKNCYFTKPTSKKVISTENNLFGPKKWVSLVLGEVYKNCTKIKEKCYFPKLILKRVISTVNHLFFTKYKIIMKFGQE